MAVGGYRPCPARIYSAISIFFPNGQACRAPDNSRVAAASRNSDALLTRGLL
jgi:hypothetical protein